MCNSRQHRSELQLESSKSVVRIDAVGGRPGRRSLRQRYKMNKDVLVGRNRAEVRSRRGMLGRRFLVCTVVSGIALLLTVAAAPGAPGATPATSPVASTSSIDGKNVNLNGAPMPAGATL